MESGDACANIRREKRAMERHGSSSAATSASPFTDDTDSSYDGSGRGGALSFSTFLMDDVLSPMPVQAAAGRSPPPLPPLRAQAAATARGSVRNGRAAAAPPPRRPVGRRREEDIPVLEAARDSSGSRLSGSDLVDVDVGSDDDEEDDGTVARVILGRDDDEFVPVLQSQEDAARSSAHMWRTISWRPSSRRGVSSSRNARVPDQETLLRMSTRSTELSGYSSSNSLGSRRGSSSRIEREMVRSGWLYKQANVMKTWKRRYFLLVKRTNTATGEFSATLQYFRGSNFGRLRGEVHLQEDRVLVRFLEPGEIRRPFCFEVAGPDFSYLCSGSNDDDATAWVCLLQSLSRGADAPSASALVGTAAASSLHQPEGGDGVRTTTIDARSIRIVAELRRLLHTSKSPEAVQFKSFVGGWDHRSVGALRQFRDFHATLTESIVRDHGARILTALNDAGNNSSDANGDNSSSSNGAAGASASSRGDEKRRVLPVSMDILRSAVSRHVEEVLFVPLQSKINLVLRRQFHEDEASINRKVRWLQGKDQVYFNIPLDQISWKEWRHASRILSEMAKVSLPAAKYDVLTATMREIQATFAEEHNTLLELEPLETDDMIPIFTYVLSNSGLENLMSLKTLLTELNGSWTVGRSPDDGNSLSILTHAVDFISNVSIPAVLEDIFKDQITLSIDGDWRRVLEFEVEPTYRYGAVVQAISPHGYNSVGSTITRGYVLVTVNGQNVVLWPFQDIMAMLLESTSPHRLAFIPGSSYFKILTANKALWNVALIHACQRGDVFSVQMLLANGADVNYVAHECGGNTPLHVAVSSLHFNVVSYMLQHGAKVKTIGEYGRSALHMVGSPCSLPSLALTTSAAANVAKAAAVAASGAALSAPDKAVLIIKKLLAHGAPLDTVDIYGNTPLMLLAEKGYLGAIDTLIEADGNRDLNARNWQRGMSALALAAKDGHADVVEGLLDYGAQVDTRTLQGETPLHFGAAIASRRVCQLLVERGCPVDVRTSKGLTPLMLAAARGHGMAPVEKIAAVSPNATRSEQQDGRNWHHKTVDLRSSLHVDNSWVISTINYLVQSGADLMAVCELYRLPLHYAAMHGCDELFACLLAKMGDEANAETRDLYGQSAVAMAEASQLSEQESVDEITSNDGSSTRNRDFSDVVEDEDDSGDEDDEEDEDEVEQADIPMSLTERKDLSGKSLSIKDLVTENHDGVEEIIAGTFDAVADLLLRYENYRRCELIALVWYCGYSSSSNYCGMVDFLRDLVKRSPAGTDAGFYVRRMVLSALDKLVEILKHNVECDMDVSNYIVDFYSEMVPLHDELATEDPQCAHWLQCSLLPAFADACRANNMQEFQVLSFCEGDYTSLKRFICTAKQANPTLKFLDDDLFGTASGMEIISATMRRRLSIAGVWKAGETKKSFVVKPEETVEDTPSEGRSTTITPWQPRGVNVGRPYPGDQRQPRLWILDLDPSIVAQQITLLQHYIFSKIKASEVLASKRSAEKTPGYQRLRLLHNHISIWVVGQMLVRDDVDQRAEILAYFIRVAGVLLSPLQNLDGFMAVMNAANDSSMFRLKKTWGRLPPQARDLWHELTLLTENGARPLNKLTKEATPPLIPYMGVMIQNVLALQEFPDRVEGDLINFKKIRSIGVLIQRMLSFQKAPYLLPTETRVLDHICSSVPYQDADACFARSLKIEPRVAATTGTAP